MSPEVADTVGEAVLVKQGRTRNRRCGRNVIEGIVLPAGERKTERAVDHFISSFQLPCSMAMERDVDSFQDQQSFSAVVDDCGIVGDSLCVHIRLY